MPIKLKKIISFFIFLALFISMMNGKAMAVTYGFGGNQSSAQSVATGDTVNVDNGGSITVSGTSNGVDGAAANNVTVNVANGGQITAQGCAQAGCGNGGGTAGKAIDLGNGAQITVANGGLIENLGKDPSGDGGINADAIYTGSNAVINISGTVLSDDNGGITNGGYNHYSQAINAGSGASITVNSSGLVQSNDFGGPTIQLVGGTGTVVNSGTIKQTFGGVAITVASSNNTVTNNGIIQTGSTNDAIAFSTAASSGNVVNLYGSSSITGYLSNYGAAGGALLNFGYNGTSADSSANDTITGNIGSSGNSWNAEAFGGTSSITGSSNFNNLQVDSLATLSSIGNSSVSGILTNNGTFKLNGIYNLNVTGTFDENSGSTLGVRANSATSYSTVTTSSAAVVSSGSAVSVTVGGYIPNNVSMEVINTSGQGIGNVPGSITSANDSYLGFSGSKSTGNLVITSNRLSSGFNSTATNPNAQAAGWVLDNETNPSSSLLTVLNNLENASGSQVSSSLKTFTPNLNNGITQVGKSSVDQFVGQAISHDGVAETGVSTGSDMLKGISVWAEGLGGHQHQDPQGSSNGYNANIWGTIVGFEKEISDFIKVGFAEGFGNDMIRSKDNNDHTNIDSYQSTIYGNYAKDAYYLDTALSFAYGTYKNSRLVNDLGTQNIASAKFDGQDYSTYIEGGYKLDVQKFQVTPLASFEYLDEYLPKYTESGAGPLDLNVSSQNYNFAQTGLGFKVGYPLAEEGFSLLPELKFKWLHDWVGDAEQTTASFVGGGNSFTTNAFGPDKSTYDFGAKLTLYTKGDITISLDYDFYIRKDFQSNTGYLNVKYSF